MSVNHKKYLLQEKIFMANNTQFTLLYASEELKLLGLLFRAFPNCPSHFLRSESVTLYLFWLHSPQPFLVIILPCFHALLTHPHNPKVSFVLGRDSRVIYLSKARDVTCLLFITTLPWWASRVALTLSYLAHLWVCLWITFLFVKV